MLATDAKVCLLSTSFNKQAISSSQIKIQTNNQLMLSVGGLEHGFYFSIYFGNVIIPTDELIFFRGVGIPPTSSRSYPLYFPRQGTPRPRCRPTADLPGTSPTGSELRCWALNVYGWRGWKYMPSSNFTCCYWKWLINSWFTYSKWWFSQFAFCMFTRGYAICLPFGRVWKWWNFNPQRKALFFTENDHDPMDSMGLHPA